MLLTLYNTYLVKKSFFHVYCEIFLYSLIILSLLYNKMFKLF